MIKKTYLKNVLAKLVAVAVITATTTTLFVGCTSKSGDADVETGNGTVTGALTNAKIEGEKATGDTMVTTVVEYEPPPSLQGNPYAKAGPNWSTLPLMFDYLCDYAALPEKTFKPALLENYTYENGVLTMTLRDGLKWSDGSDLTVDDVMTTLFLQANRSQIWNYVESYAVEGNTMTFKLVTESQLFLNMIFATPIHSPKSVYGKWAEQYEEIIATGRELNEDTGYYKFTPEATEKLTEVNNNLLEYLPKIEEVLCSGTYYVKSVNTTEMMFAANENFRNEIEIKTVRGLREANNQTYAIAVQEKQYDVENAGLSPELHQQVVSKFGDDMRQFVSPSYASIGYSFNLDKYPTNIPEVRKAINCAVDKEAIAPIAEPGCYVGDTKNTGLLPSMIEDFSEKEFYDGLEDYSYNLEKAAGYLESIGWTKGSNGKWIDDKGEVPTIEIVVVGGWAAFVTSGEAITSMLNDFGFNAVFKPMEEAACWEYAEAGNASMVCDFFGGAQTYNHPYEAYNGIGWYGKRMGIIQTAGKDLIFTNPITGEEFNHSQGVQDLFKASTKEETIELTQEFMQFYNDYCLAFPLIEKYSVTRVYNNNLSLAEAPINEQLSNYYWNGTLTKMLAKMIKDGEMYVVE